MFLSAYYVHILSRTRLLFGPTEGDFIHFHACWLLCEGKIKEHGSVFTLAYKGIHDTSNRVCILQDIMEHLST